MKKKNFMLALVISSQIGLMGVAVFSAYTNEGKATATPIITSTSTMVSKR